MGPNAAPVPHFAVQRRDPMDQRIRELAGAAGIEPAMAIPKTAALPLGHAPTKFQPANILCGEAGI